MILYFLRHTGWQGICCSGESGLSYGRSSGPSFGQLLNIILNGLLYGYPFLYYILILFRILPSNNCCWRISIFISQHLYYSGVLLDGTPIFIFAFTFLIPYRNFGLFHIQIVHYANLTAYFAWPLRFLVCLRLYLWNIGLSRKPVGNNRNARRSQLNYNY